MLRLEISDVADLRAKLGTLAREISDFGPLWDEYAGIMSEMEAQWFASEGDGTWPPLAPSTLREKARHGDPLVPLIRTGALEESLVDPAQAMRFEQGRSTLGTFTAKEMTWGTDVTDSRGREYAHYHQHSDPVTGEPMDYGMHPPERQVIPWPLPLGTRAQMLAADEAFIDEAIRRSGLDH